MREGIGARVKAEAVASRPARSICTVAATHWMRMEADRNYSSLPMGFQSFLVVSALASTRFPYEEIVSLFSILSFY